MSRYTAVTDADRQAMLDAIGISSLDELFAEQIPGGVRLQGGLDLPEGMPEQEVYAHLLDLARKNTSAEDEITFLGAGMYDHYVPALIDMLLGRSEFLTPYTPYQPEVSQGGLQVMFEYQTAICELTGMDISNASVYEGPSAVAAAGYLAKLANKRTKYLVSAGLHPDSRRTLETLSVGYGTEVIEVPLKDGVTDLEALKALAGDDTSAILFQQPNFLGAIEDVQALSDAAHAVGALSICQADPLALGVLEAPAARALTCAWVRGRRSATDSTLVARRSASSPRRPSTRAACLVASPVRPPMPTAAAASCSRCRRASSTSAARRRPPTSAPRRR